MGLGLLAWACGRSSKNPLPNPASGEGGCGHDCAADGGASAGDSTGTVDAIAGTVSRGGSFSPQAGGPSTSGTAGVPGACIAGETLCVGNEVRACNEGGFLEPGEDCGKLICEGTTCQPKLCLPGSNLCIGRDVYSCLGRGAKAQLKRSCLLGNGCAAVPGTVDCVVLACEPDATACVDNQIGACAPDGAALSSVSQDCAEHGKVCDASGSCSAVAIDEVGGDTETLVATHFFNAIDVQSARRLTKLEIGITPQAGDVSVHWQIYRQLYPGSDGFVDMLAEADSVLLAGEASAVTTELSYVFETGKRYYVGAKVDTFDDVNAAAVVVGEPQQLSFGLINVPNNVLHVFEMRITTELP